VILTDLGLAQRPDLVDSHTIHFHGFRNAIPLFDGVPELSIAVPIGRDFTYFYRPHEPGTYMYHCHFEDVEHVHMGMTGLVFVRPYQNNGIPSAGIPAGKYCYNDAVDPTADPLYPWPAYTSGTYTPTPKTAGVSAYDREFAVFLSEIWAEMHWSDAHIATTDWSEYDPDFWLMNGRVYPDTILPAGGDFNPTTGDLIPPGDPVTGLPITRLQYQPHTSLIKANSGDRVLLRFVNLGYTQAAMTLEGLPMHVVGRDATLLRGRDGTDLTYYTDTLSFGGGESFDVIFTAPSVSAPTRYLLYNRKLAQLRNSSAAGPGGQMTEVWIYPGTLSAQTAPQT
jgi:FtsP/CotA-like multicopper oxidase with cupredoxin domain